ncbi:MAG: pyridoxal phosphate-dependent aminotransferase [Deltaproteobacteria bacterium]|nr:pyridoxal phosphate-dependent aminotransferase [Deltaproteobacteria bacterium]MBW2307229.1 pyridoxal phosphate-dependent aminotransferase [Deltaproteobacteria bacterium]
MPKLNEQKNIGMSQRVMGLPPFIVMDVMERSAELEMQGCHIIHLEVGEPDFDTPPCIIEAAERAMRDGETHYTHSLGLLPLREAICRHYHRQYGVTITPDRVGVTMGSSPAFLLVLGALVNPGDEVILSDPHYSCYPNYLRFLEGKSVFVNVHEEDGFQYRPEEILPRINPSTRAVIINSPANPTGNLLSSERMAHIANLGPMIISDEIYHGLVYEGREHSILEFTDRAFIINGFSKAFAMTGWRLGYIIMPEEFKRPIQKMLQNFFISPNAFVQRAGITALDECEADVERMRSIYDQRRKLMISRLKEMGFGITVEPTGAFYVLASARRFTDDSYRLAFDILENAHVGVAPGIDFGQNAEGYLRFSYATSLENIEEGMGRIRAYLQKQFP